MFGNNKGNNAKTIKKFTFTKNDWSKAMADRNTSKMEEILRITSTECGKPNSYCLVEVFCPECPLGLMPVQSYKKRLFGIGGI